ncbi:hypothetical protein TsFJ059_000446 [Trichoderma semiorbis]|uniref:Uncharacterized protein n=1 Tax=Trichoderma semiorbis TaxID=1491008 RepID=A0A9P8HLZ2_9HYPO|nr:hypothetical protein TsFJ059_000446 [Trichoderma semiorbis]
MYSKLFVYFEYTCRLIRYLRCCYKRPTTEPVIANRLSICLLIYPRIRYPKSSNPPVTAADSRHAAKLGHGIWHAGILSLGQAHGSCRLIRPWGSWHIAMFMLSRSLVPASWYRFNHACPPLTARSIIGPWLIHATPVHLRFLPAVIYNLCRNLDHIDTPDAQVASLPNSPGPYHTFSHPARKTTTPTFYLSQYVSKHELSGSAFQWAERVTPEQPACLSRAPCLIQSAIGVFEPVLFLVLISPDWQLCG